MDIASLGAQARSYLMPDAGDTAGARTHHPEAAVPEEPAAPATVGGYEADGTAPAPSSRIAGIDIYA